MVVLIKTLKLLDESASLLIYSSYIRKPLMRDGGFAMLQCITMPENQFDLSAEFDEHIARLLPPIASKPEV